LGGHDNFFELLDASQSTVWMAAQWLVSRGFNVKVNASGKTPDHENWKKYADNGDLEVSQRVEVKRSGYDFTCAQDYPFENMIVCAKHSYDNAIPKPYVYLIFNKAGTHVARIYSRQRHEWFEQEKEDGRFKGYKQVFYFINRNKVNFVPLGQADLTPA
jgi:hypothetical protein